MTDFKDVANQFASALVKGDYSLAQSHLAEPIKSEHPPDKLQELYTGMLAYINGAVAETTEVVETMTDWPNKQSQDIGWAYVAINGQTFSEGVTLTFIDTGGHPQIREVIWGRP
jgi:hypothetical protein